MSEHVNMGAQMDLESMEHFLHCDECKAALPRTAELLADVPDAETGLSYMQALASIFGGIMGR